LVLDYYDKTYTHDLQRRGVPVHSIDVVGCSPISSARLLVEKANYLLKNDQTIPISATSP
jgi:tRNA 2-selenouridine synthase